MVHRPGRSHGNADALSRMPCHQCGRDSHYLSVSVNFFQADGSLEGGSLWQSSADEIRQLQMEDEVLGPLLRALENKSKPTENNFQGESAESRRLLQLWDQLVSKQGVLHRLFVNQQSSLQLVVPKTSRKEVFDCVHSGAIGGHLGMEKTLSRLKERFYWPGQWNDVRDWCQTCTACARRKGPAPKHRAPLQRVKAGSPMQIVAVDILGPLPETSSGNKYILVAADYFTKWVEAYAIPNQEAVTIARKLTDEMFCMFSPPERLHSDQGRQFESRLVAEVCKVLGIRKTRTTPYHPQSDGMVERFNRTLLSMLATAVEDHPSDWEEILAKMCMAYNTSVQSTTGFTPFFLMYGRQARLPVDLMYGVEPGATSTPDEYAAKLRSTLEKAYATVRKTTNMEQKRQKDYYDRKVHGKPFSAGDLVWLFTPVVGKGKHRKFHCPWTGPYLVKSRLSDVNYRIQDIQHKRRRIVVHFDRLKKCTPGSQLADEETTSPEQTQPNVDSQERGPTTDNLEMVEDDDVPQPPVPLPQPRYPQRLRHPPDRFQ